jgi:DNA (cytosine-5)-methyltransferase 1
VILSIDAHESTDYKYTVFAPCSQSVACDRGNVSRRTAESQTPEAKTFCEFFAGIGLIRAALEPSGWECAYANDIDPKKREAYHARFGAGGHFHLGDVSDTGAVVARIRGRPFLATASFPCVDLSVAGHYRGFAGEHSSTFFAFARVIEALGERRPRVVLLENVPGLLTARKGEDFAAVVRRLADLGYWVDAFVLDACHFTPQSRPRVFVVGICESLKPDDRPAAGCLWPAEPVGALRPASVARRKHSLDLSTGRATGA